MLKRDTRSGFMQCKISLTRVLRANANHCAVFRGGIPGVFVSYVSDVFEPNCDHDNHADASRKSHR